MEGSLSPAPTSHRSLVETLGGWRLIAVRFLLLSILLIALGLLLVVLETAFFATPPLVVHTANPHELGIVCPGDFIPVENQVEVTEPSVIFYNLSTMDASGTYNIVGTQTAFLGFPHPRAGSFDQTLPWEVPDLPEGEYVRALAARGTDGRQKSVIIEARYTIGSKEQCNGRN